MDNCLFCKIIAGDIPSTKVYEDDKVYAFRDINPQAPVHVLIVPKKHMANVLECDGETAAALTAAVGEIARQEGGAFVRAAGAVAGEQPRAGRRRRGEGVVQLAARLVGREITRVDILGV